MNTPDDSPLPIDQWSDDMDAAVNEICRIGRQILRTHEKASPKAAEVASGWKLAERLQDEHEALGRLFQSVRRMLESMEVVGRMMRAADVDDADLHQAMRQCANTIEEGLPTLQQDFLTVRRCALDLLRWTRRDGRIEGSELPDTYRAGYAKLIAYTPIFRPRIDAMQQELLQRSQSAHVHADVQGLLSALSHYKAIAESARGFVRSVVEPPSELTFHDTELFLEDWEKFAVAERGNLATELNDCCQFLLYDPDEFRRRVESIQPPLPDGVDASLFVLSVGDGRIVFTVDEDPVFEQTIVTLLRVVDASDFEAACDGMIQALYRDFS